MKYTISIFTALFLVPALADAHVKWFAEAVEPVRPYSFSDTPVWIGIVGVLIVLALGIFLDKKLSVFEGVKKLIQKSAPVALSLASVGFGLAFIIFTWNGFIFAPNLPAEGSLGAFMLGLQGLAGVMMLFGLYERLGGLIILVLFAVGIIEHGALEMIDTLEMVGFALYAMIVGRPLWKVAETEIFQKLTHRMHAYGLPLLRVGTGLNLIVLGFSEKIFATDLTQSFLTQYHWNFMQNIGFTWFTDYWFAFAAGLGEITFGLFFLLGLITRTTTIALAVFLVTTLILLGPVELVGHLPHFSIALVLVVLGSGARLKLLKDK
jgi:uncharacterized membrane protein YphA (DoxX/SURF4 family)